MSTAIATTQRDALGRLQGFLQKRRHDIEQALPAGFDAARVARIALTTIARGDSQLAVACASNQASFWAAMLESAQLGLTLDGPLGQAYLIPRKNRGNLQVTLQIGYKGWVALACRSGHVTHVSADVVREGDFFEYEQGSAAYLRHIPNVKERKDGYPSHAYAVAHMGSKSPPFVVLTREAVHAARDFGGNTGPRSPWTLHPDAMWKKTAISRLCSGRFFPLSAELRRAAVVEEDAARMTLPATARVDPDEPGDYDPETGEVLDGTWDEEAAAEEAMARAEREGREPQS